MNHNKNNPPPLPQQEYYIMTQNTRKRDNRNIPGINVDTNIFHDNQITIILFLNGVITVEIELDTST